MVRRRRRTIGDATFLIDFTDCLKAFIEGMQKVNLTNVRELLGKRQEAVPGRKMVC